MSIQLKTIQMAMAIGLWFLLVAGATHVEAAQLDPSFGNHGTAVVPNNGSLDLDSRFFGVYSGEPTAFAVDSRGRILLGGGTGFSLLVTRFTPTGRIDTSFGMGGTARVPLPDAINPVRAIQVLVRPDGTIVIVGEESSPIGDSHISLALLNDDGTQNHHISSSWLTPLNMVGSTVLTQSRRIAIAGARIAEMDSEGYAPASFAGVVMRRRIDGTPDRTFARGRGFFDFDPKTPDKLTLQTATVATSLIALPKGKLLVGGRNLNRFMVMRLTAAGKPDKSFGTNHRQGRTIANFGGPDCNCVLGSRMARDSKHRIVQVGYAGYPFRYRKGARNRGYTTVMVRYRPDGRIDRSFGRQGFAYPRHRSTAVPTSIAIQKNNRILVTFIQRFGQTRGARFMIARYLPNGRLDRSFFGDGRYSWRRGTSSMAAKVLIDKRGRALVAGGAAIGGTGNYVLKRFLIGV